MDESNFFLPGADEERRSLPADLSLNMQSGKPKIVGYAAVFNSFSRPIPVDRNKPDGKTFREIIRPGAFARSLLAGREVFARADHQDYLARTGNGTLRVTEDQRGLRYEIDPPDTQVGRDLVALIRRGDVHESSFGFRVQPEGQTWLRSDGLITREIRAAELVDVGPTFHAAYAATSASLRSLLASGVLDDGQPGLELVWMRLRLAEASLPPPRRG